MILSLEKEIKIKKLKEKLNFLESHLDFEINQEKMTIYKKNIINEVIKDIKIPTKINSKEKREISLILKEKIQIKNLKLNYIDCKTIIEFIMIGHKKINLKSYNSYLKLKENQKKH